MKKNNNIKPDLITLKMNMKEKNKNDIIDNNVDGQDATDKDIKDNDGKTKTKKWKVGIIAIESVLIVLYSIITVYYVWYHVDKNGFIKNCSKNPLVRMYLNYTTKDDYKDRVQDTDFNQDKLVTNENVDEQLDTYRNIALFGVDSRKTNVDEKSNSDSIIIVSINNKTGEVKLASVYRDTMLKMENSKGNTLYTKANAAFAIGGAESAINMLNTNLDLNITDYAVVNFSGLARIIDELGGIDVNITPEEKFYINGYLVETREVTGMEAPDVTQSGPVHLSGLQATAYCRIRYVTFYDEDGTKYLYDMGRTARQRSVIKKLVEKAKLAGVSEVKDIANTIMNYNSEDEKILTTSLTFNEVMNLIPTMIDFTLTDSTGFPFTCDTPTIDGASMVVAQGLSYNVEKLHQYLFDEEDYSPSMQVKSISDYLEKNTGIKTVLTKEDQEKETNPANSQQTTGTNQSQTTPHQKNSTK